MNNLITLLQIIAALGILNVWLIRSRRATNWRGGNAKTMQEEFSVYGLPAWSVTVIGSVKVALAMMMIAGLWVSELTRPASLALACLMLGAVLMHFKVKDPITKSLPALTVLGMSLLVGLS